MVRFKRSPGPRASQSGVGVAQLPPSGPLSPNCFLLQFHAAFLYEQRVLSTMKSEGIKSSRHLLRLLNLASLLDRQLRRR
jgi:hypothetical protein